MSPTPAPRGRPARGRSAALALAAVGALAGSLLTSTGSATAAGSTAASDTSDTSDTSDRSGTSAARPELSRVPAPTMRDGRYIVLLRQASAATYDGSGRFSRTRPTAGEQFDARSAAARSYRAHLVDTQESVARSVGATVLRNYSVASNGFVARLTGRQASNLSLDRRVLLVERDTVQRPDTWNTPDFLGLTGPDGAWTTHGGPRRAGAGTVVGIIDSGIWPESESFAGGELTPQPHGKWDVYRREQSTYMDKADGDRFVGTCQPGEAFTVDDCNRKLIGARDYADLFPVNSLAKEEYRSPRDGNGHGSHTAGTAAGNNGVPVTVEGREFGRVSGMAPAAKIASYKVCYTDRAGENECYTSATLAAVDDAITDGVDVLNYSISGSVDTVVDAVEIAFEGAAEAGVFVATSAGNSGPGPETVAHPSPWVTTVAATTHVSFEGTVVLGNGEQLGGASSTEEAVASSPLRSSTDVAAAGQAADEATLCAPGSLDPAEAAGAIVVCTRGVYTRVEKSTEVERVGGVGMVLVNPTENSLDFDLHAVPTVHLQVDQADDVFAYLEAAGDDATASIQPGNLTGEVTPVPQIAGFSSRGPSLANEGDILKPDISAPGVGILAAVAPPFNLDRDYDLISGTSMSSPHIAGLAAFLMSQDPLLTPMQVKSAMMTTATSVRDETGARTDDTLAEGAGLVRPKRFFDPGLTVTSGPREWRGLLAHEGLDLGVVSPVRPVAPRDLNQPSMAESQVTGETVFTRRFTATRRGTWTVSFDVPGFKGRTDRPVLRMDRRRDVEDVRFRFTRTTAPIDEYAVGHVVLDGPVRVRLPVALKPVAVAAPEEVGGTGVTGSEEVTITPGFSGELPITESGLAPATTAQDTVAVDEVAFSCTAVGPDNRALRADLDAAQDDADLDLYVFTTNAACDELGDEVGSSATGAADEQVTLANLAAGNYLVAVAGFADGADGDDAIDYRLDVFDVQEGTGVGDFRVEPNPVPVTFGEPTTIEVLWSGLAAGRRYLGVLDYGTSQATSTFVTVDTTP